MFCAFLLCGKARRVLLEPAAEVIQQRIYRTVREIETLGGTCVEIRLHREQCREWMYFVDQKRIYVGLVRKGTERHHNPALVLTDDRKKPGIWNLYDQYKQQWETLWDNARPYRDQALLSGDPSRITSAATVKDALSASPNAKTRIALLSGLDECARTPSKDLLDVILSRDFLECRVEDVRKATALWLDDHSTYLAGAEEFRNRVAANLLERLETIVAARSALCARRPF